MTVIKIRQGLNGYPFSACTEEGYFITNADSIEDIKENWKWEIRHKRVKIVKELHLYPEGKKPEYVVYGYARVSTRGQQSDGNGLEAQEKALKDAGAEIIFKDTYTGKTTDRPEFNRLKSLLNGGDTLIVTKLDRFARSISQANDLITELLEKRVKIHILNVGLIDNSPTSKLMRSMLLAFAEFERDMIVERTQEGKAIARTKEGYREGRPRTDQKRLDLAMKLLQDHSYNQVAELTKLSKSTIQREARKRGFRKS